VSRSSASVTSAASHVVHGRARELCARARALCERADAAIAQATAVVTQTGARVARAQVVYAAVWDARFERWCARPERPSRRRSRRASGRALRRAAVPAVPSSAVPPEPSAFTGPHGGHWAHATVLGERRLGGAVDAIGESWIVRELDARSVPAAHGPRCLVFENHRLVRRLWEYPAAWLSLSDAALLAIAGLGP